MNYYKVFRTSDRREKKKRKTKKGGTNLIKFTGHKLKCIRKNEPVHTTTSEVNIKINVSKSKNRGSKHTQKKNYHR